MKYTSKLIKNNAIKYSFVSNLFSVTWGFVYHGIKEGYIDHRFPIDFANDYITIDNADDEILLNIYDAQPHYCELEENILFMVQKENELNVDYEKQWFLVFASYIYYNYQDIKDVENVLAILVDDFGYMEGTLGLVYYMPREKGNSSKSLFEFLENYLNEELKIMNQ